MKPIYNCHIHLFTTKNVPDRFFGLITPILMNNPKLVDKLKGTMLWLGKNGPFKSFQKYAAYVGISEKGTQASVLNYIRGFYPGSTKYAVLTMDFDFMEKGKSKEDYMVQLKELADLKKNPELKELIFPFVNADPRRPNLLDLVKEYIEVHGFTGIKLYPSLGFYPDDERLSPIYDYANEKKLPITAHCIPVNAVFYGGNISDQDKAKAKSLDPKFKFRSNYEFTRYYNHPLNYKKVLEEFKDLKLNLAHFGGNEEWDKYLNESWDHAASPVAPNASWFSIIKDMLVEYKNLYSDISFTVSDPKLFPLLKIVLQDQRINERILFGSDFYMLEKNVTERRYSIDVRGYLDKSDFELISYTNPLKFLN